MTHARETTHATAGNGVSTRACLFGMGGASEDLSFSH